MIGQVADFARYCGHSDHTETMAFSVATLEKFTDEGKMPTMSFRYTPSDGVERDDPPLHIPLDVFVEGLQSLNRSLETYISESLESLDILPRRSELTQLTKTVHITTNGDIGEYGSRGNVWVVQIKMHFEGCLWPSGASASVTPSLQRSLRYRLLVMPPEELYEGERGVSFIEQDMNMLYKLKNYVLPSLDTPAAAAASGSGATTTTAE